MTSVRPAGAPQARQPNEGSVDSARADPRSRSRVFLLLIADPDDERASRLAEGLAEHQVTSIISSDGADALLAAGAEHPDAVLAAAALPTVGGAALTRALSARTTIPVVVGIGNGDGPAAAEALAAGAAACVAHPYRLRELLPILRAIRPGALVDVQPALEARGLRLDPSSLEVHLNGRLVRMPLREFRLLQLLMQHADRVVTRDQIRGSVWGGVAGSNTITVHIQRLRQRLGDDQDNPKLILTIRGVGYRLVPPPSTTD
jgi:DNA-binding response OmpR family regulator